MIDGLLQRGINWERKWRGMKSGRMGDHVMQNFMAVTKLYPSLYIRASLSINLFISYGFSQPSMRANLYSLFI